MASANLSSEKFRMQFTATLSCTFSMFSWGWVSGWQSLITISFEDITYGTWVPRFQALGVIIGAVLFSGTCNKMGKKGIILVSSCFYILSWCCNLLASSTSFIYIAIVLQGIGTALTLCMVPLYVSEVIENDKRATFIAYMITIGSLAKLIITTFSHRMTLLTSNLIPLIFPISSLLSLTLMPESPYFLIAKGLTDKAEENLLKIRCQSDSRSIRKELTGICNYINDYSSSKSLRKDLTKKKTLLSIGLIFFFLLNRELSKITSTALISQLVHFLNVSGSINNINMIFIVSELVGMIVGLLSGILMDRWGRRKVFFISSSGCLILSIAVGIYFELNISKFELVMLGIFLMKILYYFGISSTIFVLLSEIFPPTVKPWLIAKFVSLIPTINLIVTKLYELSNSQVNDHYTYWVFSIAGWLPVAYAYFYMEETNNKSLDEIQKDMNNTRPVTSIRVI